MGVRKTEVGLIVRPRGVKTRGVSAVQATLLAIDLQDVVNQLDASSCPPLSLGGNWIGVLSLPLLVPVLVLVATATSTLTLSLVLGRIILLAVLLDQLFVQRLVTILDLTTFLSTIETLS